MKSPLCILSTNREDTIRGFLRRFGFPEVEAVVCRKGLEGKASGLKALKRRFKDHSHVIYICDEIRDVIACKKANVYSFHVDWGANDAKVVRLFPTTWLGSRTEELLPWIETVLGVLPPNRIKDPIRCAAPFGALPSFPGLLKKLRDSTLFLPLLLFPPGPRRKLLVLYLLLREIDDSIDSATNDRDATMKANAWLAFIQGAYGRKTGIGFLDRALNIIEKDELRLLKKIIRSQRLRIDAREKTVEQIEAWALAQNGPLGELILESLGVRHDWTEQYIEDLAIGFQLVNLCKDVIDDLRANSILIPGGASRFPAGVPMRLGKGQDPNPEGQVPSWERVRQGIERSEGLDRVLSHDHRSIMARWSGAWSNRILEKAGEAIEGGY
uniref:Squalene/phytoene synthase n=1 Tax=Candidatus Kentrum sp. TC TaxID=2126339 RepID=A0A450YVP1_9GAMM|nr:MAG: Squalene/phytoene synthase [Candidatus Kentron sp. TC]